MIAALNSSGATARRTEPSEGVAEAGVVAAITSVLGRPKGRGQGRFVTISGQAAPLVPAHR
jgi:hypothetical protein